MNERILKIFYDYSISGKIADKNFINKVVELLVNYKQLNGYVQNITFKDYNENDKSSISGYNYHKKSVIIFTDKIYNYLDNAIILVPNNERVFCKNVKIVHSLMHEIEHANQSKKIETENTIESQILRLVGVGKSREIIQCQLRNIGFGNIMIEKFLNDKLKIYYKYYNFAPQERLAEIDSHETIVDVLSPIRNFVPKTYNLEKTLTQKSKIKGYKLNGNLICPTAFYLEKQGELNNLSKFDWYDKSYNKSLELSKRFYSNEKRVRLGLPISQSEFNSMDKDLKLLVKKQ